jgi:hypothetical protein
MKNLSTDFIEKALNQLADPRVTARIELASTPHVASRIIQSLAGVRDLSEGGPEVEKALLTLLQDEKTIQNDHLALISVYLLRNYPSERVKLALAKPIVDRKFTGFTTQFAAEAFLNAAGIDQIREEDAIAVAMREAKKLQGIDSQKIGIKEQRSQAKPGLRQKRSTSAAAKTSLTEKRSGKEKHRQSIRKGRK